MSGSPTAGMHDLRLTVRLFKFNVWTDVTLENDEPRDAGVGFWSASLWISLHGGYSVLPFAVSSVLALLLCGVLLVANRKERSPSTGRQRSGA